MSSRKYCNIRGCRFSDSHVTKEHICGICNANGHGQIEHGNPVLLARINFLPRYIPRSECCNLTNCFNPSRETHTTRGHRCVICNEFGHDDSLCPFSVSVQPPSLAPSIPMGSDPLPPAPVPIVDEIKCPNCRKKIDRLDCADIFLQSECPICCIQKDKLKRLSCGHVICSDCCEKL